MTVAAAAPVVTAAAKRAAARRARPRASEVYPLPKTRPAAAATTPAAGPAPAPTATPAPAQDGGGFFSGVKQGAGEAYAQRDRSRYSGVGSGMLLGLLVYPLVLAYLRGGAPRAKGWLRAKFLNEPMPVAPATPGSSGRSGASGGSAGSGSSGSSSGSW